MSADKIERSSEFGGVSIAAGVDLATYFTHIRLAIALVVVLNVAGNLFVPQLVGNEEWLILIFLGALATQIALLAAAAALGTQPWLQSVTASSLMLLFSWASYIGGLRLMDSGVPVEFAILVLGITIGGFAVGYFFFRLIRPYWKAVLCDGEMAPLLATGSQEARAVSIRSLMLLTSAIAIAICIIRWSLPKETQSLPLSALWLLVIQCLFLALQSFVIFASLVWIILGKSTKKESIMVLILSMAFLPPVNVFLIQLLTRNLLYEELHFIYFYLVGLAVFSGLNLGVLRFAGLRLLKPVLGFDRAKYTFKYAPPASELIALWSNRTPSGENIESFISTELCDSSANEYFLANLDIFFAAIQRQSSRDREFSLSVLWTRLLDAAQFATTVDPVLALHFRKTLTRFAKLYFSYVNQPTKAVEPSRYLASIQKGALALNAVVIGNLALAQAIREQAC